MEFINSFVCFEEQTLELPNSVDTIKVDSPFVKVITVGQASPSIKGLELSFTDKCLMVFFINKTDNPFTLINESLDVPTNQRIMVSTGVNKIILPNTFEVLVYCGDCWMIRDINLT